MHVGLGVVLIGQWSELQSVLIGQTECPVVECPIRTRGPWLVSS